MSLSPEPVCFRPFTGSMVLQRHVPRQFYSLLNFKQKSRVAFNWHLNVDIWFLFLSFLKLQKSENEEKHCPNIEAVVWRCSVKKVFLEISQNSQENTCVRVSFLIKLQALGLLHKTPLVAASANIIFFLSSFWLLSFLNKKILKKTKSSGNHFHQIKEVVSRRCSIRKWLFFILHLSWSLFLRKLQPENLQLQ